MVRFCFSRMATELETTRSPHALIVANSRLPFFELPSLASTRSAHSHERKGAVRHPSVDIPQPPSYRFSLVPAPACFCPPRISASACYNRRPCRPTSTSSAVEDSGNSNPDSDFRFDATLGSTGGYIFNLKTTGLSTGTYKVNFTVTGDTFVYATNFEVK